jgi:hypothetical protein
MGIAQQISKNGQIVINFMELVSRNWYLGRSAEATTLFDEGHGLGTWDDFLPGDPMGQNLL